MDRLKEFFSDPWKTATVTLSAGVIALLALTLTGGDKEPDDPSAGGTTTTTSAPAQTTTPGTATTVPGPGFRGVVGIKIDNAPDARPQVGLGSAPLLAEYMAEGGITRFVAVVDAGSSGHIGPVRSLRPVDADIFPLFAPSVASTGGQSFVIREIDASGTLRAEPGSSLAFMTAERPSPHNVFIDLTSLLEEVPVFNPADPVLPAGNLPSGTGSQSAAVSEWDLEWRFENDRYTRYQGAEAFQVADRIDGTLAPLSHDVLVFLHVGQRSAGYTDSNGAEVFTYDVIGAGDMVVLHGGQAVMGSWVRRSHAEGYRLIDENGNSFGIPQGTVYIAFLPVGVDVEH